MKNKSAARQFLLLAATSVAALCITEPAMAQEAGQANGAPQASPQPETKSDEEILVTARRRAERMIDVPVIITAFTDEQLQKTGFHDVTDLGKITPQLSVELNGASFGGITTLRGVTNPTSNVATETAVTINLDGVPLSYGQGIRAAQFDVGQVEILKGPQALFFGKNSSGGIIAIKSADPTDQLEVTATSEYETYARQLITTGVVSGAITDTLRARTAVQYSGMHGFFINDAPGVAYPKGPNSRQFAGRETLIFEPSSRLTVKLKGSYLDYRDHGYMIQVQRFFCPSGRPSGPSVLPSVTDCQIDRHSAIGDTPANLAQVANAPQYRDGKPYVELRQSVLSSDINFQISDKVALNAITGYYWQDQAYADPSVRGPIAILNSSGQDNRKDFSQEIRLLSTDAGAPFSWMIGGFYQDAHEFNVEQVVQYTPPSTFTVNPQSRWTIDGKTYSAFGQASIKFLDNFTLSGGLRYTHEEKTQSSNVSNKFIPKLTFNNTSPEVTLSYKPDPNVNIFASYKQGYKSGTFQISSLAFLALARNPAITFINNGYKAEQARGFEGGLKASVFDHQVGLELAAYRYNYTNLQLSSFDPVQTITRISNAAASRIQGVEASVNYRPHDVPNLTLSTSVSYNRARYRDFVAACFVGQTIAQGCTIDGPDANTTPDQQDLAGRPLERAPDWSGNFGFDYAHDVGRDLRMTVNGQGTFQSRSVLSQESTPWGIRKGQVLLNAGASIGSSDGSWEFAFIGKNLTDKLYPVTGAQEALTGTAATTGTTLGQPADYRGQISRGREIWFRLTLRPNLF